MMFLRAMFVAVYLPPLKGRPEFIARPPDLLALIETTSNVTVFVGEARAVAGFWCDTEDVFIVPPTTGKPNAATTPSPSANRRATVIGRPTSCLMIDSTRCLRFEPRIPANHNARDSKAC